MICASYFPKNQYGTLANRIVLKYRDGMFLPVPGMASLDQAGAASEGSRGLSCLAETLHYPRTAIFPTVPAAGMRHRNSPARMRPRRLTCGRLTLRMPCGSSLRTAKSGTSPIAGTGHTYHRLAEKI